MTPIGRSRSNVCFHGIGEPGRALENGEAPYWITQDSFLRVLDVLAAAPGVRISFDDGNASDVEVALPALLERGLTAIFFPLAGRLDAPGSLGRDDVRALQAAGMEIGTHGMDHRPWRGLDPAARRRELEEARDRIGEVIGLPVTEAALPLGRYDRALLGELRRRGYRAVHTSDRRRAREGAWLQPRFSIRSHDTVETVRRDFLAPQPLTTRLERTLVTTAKRWR